MLLADDWQALVLTMKLATIVTTLLLVVSTPLAWWLSRSPGVLKSFVQAIVALPLVLPPTVIGFYLLLAFSPVYGIGQWLAALGIAPLAFSFQGLVIGSMIYSLPFVVQPLQNAFEAIGERPLEAASALGANQWQQFSRVALPLARPGYIVATVLGFAHTVGEFGIVLMIGGNIPGETRLISVSIYDHVEALDYAAANRLSMIVIGLSLLILLAVFVVQQRGQRHGPSRRGRRA